MLLNLVLIDSLELFNQSLTNNNNMTVLESNHQALTLDKDLLEKHFPVIMEIEKATSLALGPKKYGAPWVESNFRLEREGKWKFSCVSLMDNILQGFLISSVWSNNIHVHRLAVRTTLTSREKVAVQKSLYSHQHELAKLGKIRWTSTNVAEDNLATLRFYEKEGWDQMNELQLQQFISIRNLRCHVENANVLVDTVPELGHPSRAKILFIRHGPGETSVK